MRNEFGFKPGSVLEFNIYGRVVRGVFKYKKNDLVYIEVTEDYIDGSVGDVDCVHERYLVGTTASIENEEFNHLKKN